MDRKNDSLRLMDGAGYKKIIIACDSYKGCLSSREVNEAIASGIKEWNADDASPEIITLEMSDGGEGMLDAFLSAMKGERVRIHAHDALMRWIEAEYGIVDDTAIIEIAQTAGLALIEPEQRNPMKATSWGVGEMIMNAYRRGVRRFIVGLGGSATSDCGDFIKALEREGVRIRTQVQQECEEIKRKAMEEAEGIRAQATEDALKTKEGAELYAEQVLTNLEKNLTQQQQIVKNGQVYMEQLRADSYGQYDIPTSYSTERPQQTSDFVIK